MNKYDSLIEDIVDQLSEHGFKKVFKEDVDYVVSQIKKKALTPKGLIYLAAPYSYKSDDPKIVATVKEMRFNAINAVAAKLMAEGNYIFSPISHTHPIAMAGSLPGGWDYWEGYDRCILSFCTKIIVLRLSGWETSTGVQAEINIGKELGIPVEYIDL